jgi:hypothetical protein
MPAEIADEGRPAGNREEFRQQESLDLRLGNLQPDEEVGNCREWIGRQIGDEPAEPADAKLVEPAAELGRLLCGYYKESSPSQGLGQLAWPAVELGGTMPRDVR